MGMTTRWTSAPHPQQFVTTTTTVSASAQVLVKAEVTVDFGEQDACSSEAASALKKSIAAAASAIDDNTVYEAADVRNVEVEGCIGNQEIQGVSVRKVSFEFYAPGKNQANILVNAVMQTGEGEDAYQAAFQNAMADSGFTGTSVDISTMILEEEEQLDIAMRVRGGAFVLAIALLPLWQ